MLRGDRRQSQLERVDPFRPRQRVDGGLDRPAVCRRAEAPPRTGLHRQADILEHDMRFARLIDRDGAARDARVGNEAGRKLQAGPHRRRGENDMPGPERVVPARDPACPVGCKPDAVR